MEKFKPLEYQKVLTYTNLELDELRTFMQEFENFVRQDQITRMTFGQVRTIYSIINSANSAQELHLKRPELAFVAAKQESNKNKEGKEGGVELSPTNEVINYFIQLIKKADEDNFENIKEFTASFLKYHKLYGTGK